MRVQIIVASTRKGRAADRVLPWLVRAVEAHDELEGEVVDLRDWPLPMFGENFGTLGDIADPTYSTPLVKAWNNKLAEADGYIVLTPEYNHSVPGVLKNAIDSAWLSFALRNKPLATVAYSVGIAAGARAVEHLAAIAVEAEMVPLRNTVLIPFVGDAFTDEAAPTSEKTDEALTIALDDLAWWVRTLAKGRADGELPPAPFRRAS